MELDTQLADFCPDIARLIRVDCTPFTESCRIENDKAIATGKAVYDILYETDYKSRLKYCSFTQEFSQALPVPRSNATDITAFCSAKCERIGCNLLSPRHLVIKATLSTDFSLEGETSVKALAVSEDECTFFRKKVIGFEGKTNIFKETYRFGDSIPLNQNEKSVGQVLCGHISLQEPQISLYPSRAEIKTIANLQILCEEENNDGQYYVSEKTLPITIEYQNEDIADFKRTSVHLEAADGIFTPELDQYGENRIIKADFSVRMVLKSSEPKAYTVAEDVFEKSFDSQPVITHATLPIIYSQQESSFVSEFKIEDMNPAPVSLLTSSVRDGGFSAEAEEGGVNIKGNFLVTLLAQTTEGIYSFDRALPYSQLIPVEIPHREYTISASVNPSEVIITRHSDGSATAKVIAMSRLTISTQQEESFVSDLENRVAVADATDSSDIVYRFPQKGEDLWSIAKSYRANPKSISDANPDRLDDSGKFVSTDLPILIKL